MNQVCEVPFFSGSVRRADVSTPVLPDPSGSPCELTRARCEGGGTCVGTLGSEDKVAPTGRGWARGQHDQVLTQAFWYLTWGLALSPPQSAQAVSGHRVMLLPRADTASASMPVHFSLPSFLSTVVLEGLPLGTRSPQRFLPGGCGRAVC